MSQLCDKHDIHAKKCPHLLLYPIENRMKMYNLLLYPPPPDILHSVSAFLQSGLCSFGFSYFMSNRPSREYKCILSAAVWFTMVTCQRSLRRAEHFAAVADT